MLPSPHVIDPQYTVANVPNFDLNVTFFFDLNGYFIFRNFLRAQQVERMNAAIDRSDQVCAQHKFMFLGLDDIFRQLIGDRRVLEICNEWISPHFRFDHAFGSNTSRMNRPKSPTENLHGGPYAEQGYFQYHWWAGKPNCTCLLFAYALEPQPAGQGGLILVPGSHKSNLGISSGEIFQHRGRGEWLVQPALQAGDMLVLTESVMHGTQPCRGGRRRNIYYKYGYGSMGRPDAGNEDIQRLRENASDEQERRLFAPAYVARMSGNVIRWRPRTLLPSDQCPPSALSAASQEGAISYCVPLKTTAETSYRTENFLKMVQALIDLGESNMELIVGDYGSELNWDVIRTTCPFHVTVVALEGYFNRSVARNRAADAASGSTLFFLDADVRVPHGFGAEVRRSGGPWAGLGARMHPTGARRLSREGDARPLGSAGRGCRRLEALRWLGRGARAELGRRRRRAGLAARSESLDFKTICGHRGTSPPTLSP